MRLPCRAVANAAMHYSARARESSAPTLEAKGALSSYNKQAKPDNIALERKMTGPTIEVRRTNRVRLSAVFVAFFRLGVVSFGGGTAGWLYREIVERRRWINDAEFLSGAALGRLMPGSGGVNLTVQVGQHLHGGSGALAAVLGLLSGPLAIILALA